MRPSHTLAFVVALATSVLASLASAADRPLNLLFFGNSYSQFGVQHRVQDLAVADGHPQPLVLAATKGGQDLHYHLGQVAQSPAENVDHPSISGRTWDRVIIQALSTEALNSDANALPYRADALTLYRAVRDHTSGRGVGATAVLTQTWARGAGHPAMYPKNFADPAAMQAEIVANTGLANADINGAEGADSAIVAPAGEAFGRFGWAPWLYNDDLHHPSPAGNLLQSMVVYRAIYGEDVGDIPFHTWQSTDRSAPEQKIDEATWARLAKAADSVVIAGRVPASQPAKAGREESRGVER